jgi:hypothetical protein
MVVDLPIFTVPSGSTGHSIQYDRAFRSFNSAESGREIGKLVFTGFAQ